MRAYALSRWPLDRLGYDAWPSGGTAPTWLKPPPSSLSAQERLRELLLTLAAGVASPDSVRLYRAVVAEADRMPGLGHLFWETGPREVRVAIAQLWAEEHDAATAPSVAEQLVHPTLLAAARIRA